ncbi:MAG: hypothetical protein ACLR6W_08645 [Evtepia sp.]
MCSPWRRGAMVVVVLLGVMGSLDAVMRPQCGQFRQTPVLVCPRRVTERNVGINWSTVLFLVGMMVMVEG